MRFIALRLLSVMKMKSLIHCSAQGESILAETLLSYLDENNEKRTNEKVSLEENCLRTKFLETSDRDKKESK